ncbi:MAG TPA: farnesyl diphosphate synthase [Gammaproteobacteria bacterium]|nr:farnesyl diphosphate synthase [Gammaproteobacteria bacterium]
MPFKERIPAYLERVERALDRWLPPADRPPQRLHEAMRYAVLGGGKRIRPLLIYATGEMLDIPPGRLDGPACAVEIVHAYSLVHDDLPAMDDDDLRRGRPTCHRAFDEATAILAGDALQVLAFYILAHDRDMAAEPAARLRMIEQLALASGSHGMAGGQAMDLAAMGRTDMTPAELELMHVQKTGALIRASVLLAALAARAVDADTWERLDHYGKCVGLAFQIRDDILDVEGETEMLGKLRGADAVRAKPTYPSVLGMEESKARALALHHEAIGALEPFGARAEPLRWLSEHIVTRHN